MVGLPYPDKRDPELKQKMAYLDDATPGRFVQPASLLIRVALTRPVRLLRIAMLSLVVVF